VIVSDRADPGLADSFTQFCGYPSPRILLPLSAVAVSVRAALGGWRKRDLGIASAIIAAEPFTEWIIHVAILHFRPRRLLGRRVDPLLARKHREHHQDPRDPELIFVPMPVLRALLPVAIAAWGLGERNVRTALTGAATSYAMLTVYEWTHFLIHSSYKPRHRPYRAMWRAHRFHHFRNENYWFGITSHVADKVLHTFPEPGEVPRSATARTLGVEAAA
jgi:hypothetical protein